MLVEAGKYAKARPGSTPGRAPIYTGKEWQAKAFDIWMKPAKELTPQGFMDWWHRELKDGGYLHEYMRREKALTPQRYRDVARRQHGIKHNNKSDIRRRADIPLRDFFRWQREDPHFFEDDKNLKSLKRDNPDVCVYV